MAIENRNLQPGTRLNAKYRKQPYYCEVVQGEGDKVRYRLEDGREFKSPSAAGMAITDKACNGWAFWSIDPPNPEPARAETQPETGQTEDAAPTKPGAARAKRRIFRVGNQKGTPEGQTRWFCPDCGKSFLATTTDTPETCPQGHRP